MTFMSENQQTARGKGRQGRKPACYDGMSAQDGTSRSSVRRSFRPFHAMSVPKNHDLGCYYSPGNEKTTAMFRNIPNKYTQASLLKEIDSMDFAGTYNFFYLPMDTHNQTNVGYAFINFVYPSDMERFIQIFTGHQFRTHLSPKIGRVSAAHLQGFVENVYQYANCAVAHSHKSHYRPIVVYKGVRRDITDVASELSYYAGCEAEGVPLPPPGLEMMPASGFNRTAVEFVPASLCAQELTETQNMTTTENMDSNCTVPFAFSLAKEGLESAVLQWLQGSQATTSSVRTEGKSGVQSGSATPPSASTDFEAEKDLQELALGLCESLVGQDSAELSPTPRTNRTLLSSNGF